MSSPRHAAARKSARPRRKPAVGSDSVTAASAGRHRAPSRSPVTPAAIGMAVAVVAGGIGAPAAVSATSGSPGAERLPAETVGVEIAQTDVEAAPASVQAAPGTAALATVEESSKAAAPATTRIVPVESAKARDESVRAARARARELLAERVEEIGEAARKSAATAVERSLARKGCGYVARIQREPKLDAAQLRNVRAIVEVAKDLGLPPRAAVIALATAHQESWLKNLSWGDRDSLGLFQQRPSMGWGSRSQISDPQYAARAFYRALEDVSGWREMPVTVAAQRVQRSAFGSRYAQWELMAAKLVAATTRVPAADLRCQ